MNKITAHMTDEDYLQVIKEAGDSLKELLSFNEIKDKPKVAVVLGSGLGVFTEGLLNKKIVPYKNVTHMPDSSVPGHAGQWVYGLAGKYPVLVAQGRIHYYEGHDLKVVTLLVRVMKELGIKHLILTNAAGSVNKAYHPGDFMLLRDHLNVAGISPLRGIKHEAFGPRFVDMSEPYHRGVITRLREVCQTKMPEVPVHEGVYYMSVGPHYETPSEVKMAGILGADAVGMSTIPECIVARQGGIKVNGITCITNYGSGIGKEPLSHHEVEAVGKKRAPDFCRLVNEMIGVVSEI
ncbi:MAG: purine-nucleoside phosphorylase [Deltaproteobacteria bacterium]|nr:purine-nucleoside phosphorylase [Deltaproteobacteria bacterium]